MASSSIIFYETGDLINVVERNATEAKIGGLKFKKDYLSKQYNTAAGDLEEKHLFLDVVGQKRKKIEDDVQELKQQTVNARDKLALLNARPRALIVSDADKIEHEKQIIDNTVAIQQAKFDIDKRVKTLTEEERADSRQRDINVKEQERVQSIVEKDVSDLMTLMADLRMQLEDVEAQIQELTKAFPVPERVYMDENETPFSVVLDQDGNEILSRMGVLDTLFERWLDKTKDSRKVFQQAQMGDDEDNQKIFEKTKYNKLYLNTAIVPSMREKADWSQFGTYPGEQRIKALTAQVQSLRNQRSGETDKGKRENLKKQIQKLRKEIRGSMAAETEEEAIALGIDQEKKTLEGQLIAYQTQLASTVKYSAPWLAAQEKIQSIQLLLEANSAKDPKTIIEQERSATIKNMHREILRIQLRNNAARDCIDGLDAKIEECHENIKLEYDRIQTSLLYSGPEIDDFLTVMKEMQTLERAAARVFANAREARESLERQQRSIEDQLGADNLTDLKKTDLESQLKTAKEKIAKALIEEQNRRVRWQTVKKKAEYARDRISPNVRANTKSLGARDHAVAVAYDRIDFCRKRVLAFKQRAVDLLESIKYESQYAKYLQNRILGIGGDLPDEDELGKVDKDKKKTGVGKETEKDDGEDEEGELGKADGNKKEKVEKEEKDDDEDLEDVNPDNEGGLGSSGGGPGGSEGGPGSSGGGPGSSGGGPGSSGGGPGSSEGGAGNDNDNEEEDEQIERQRREEEESARQREEEAELRRRGGGQQSV